MGNDMTVLSGSESLQIQNNSMRGNNCSVQGKRKDRDTTSDLTPNNWRSVLQLGSSPLERSGHAMVKLCSKVYMFGGCGGSPSSDNRRGGCLEDFYSFDFTSCKWHKIFCVGEKPSARASFAMCKGPLPGTLIVCGGTSDDGLHNDMFEYCIYTRKWRKLCGEGVESEGFSSQCQYYGQSLCSYNDKVILFGGSSGHKYINDTFTFDVETLRWEKITTHQEPPSPRYKHQSVVVKDFMFVIGGGNYRPRGETIDVYRLDLLHHFWDQPVCSGTLPRARVAHSCEYDEVRNSILLWGGFTKTLDRLGDFYLFDVSTNCWSLIDCEPSIGPSPRAFHSSCLHDGEFFVFGGADGETRFSDIWSYQVRGTPPTLMTLCARQNRENSFINFSNSTLCRELIIGVERVERGSSWASQKCEIPEPTLKRITRFNSTTLCREGEVFSSRSFSF